MVNLLYAKGIISAHYGSIEACRLTESERLWNMVIRLHNDPSRSPVACDVMYLPFLVYIVRCLAGMFPHGLIPSFSPCSFSIHLWLDPSERHSHSTPRNEDYTKEGPQYLTSPRILMSISLKITPTTLQLKAC